MPPSQPARDRFAYGAVLLLSLLLTLRYAFPAWWGENCDISGHLHTIAAYRDALRNGSLVPWIPDDGLGSPAAAGYGWCWYQFHAVLALVLPVQVALAIGMSLGMVAFITGIRAVADIAKVRNPDTVSIWAFLLWWSQPMDGTSGVGYSALITGLFPSWTALSILPWLITGLIRQNVKVTVISACVIIASHPMTMVHSALLAACILVVYGGWKAAVISAILSGMIMAPFLFSMASIASHGFGTKIIVDIPVTWILGPTLAYINRLIWFTTFAWTTGIWVGACWIRSPLCRAMGLFAIIGTAIAAVPFLAERTPEFFHPYRIIAPVGIALTLAMLPFLDWLTERAQSPIWRVPIIFMFIVFPAIHGLATYPIMQHGDRRHLDFTGRTVTCVRMHVDEEGMSERYPQLSPEITRPGESANGFHWITGSRTIVAVATAAQKLDHQINMPGLGAQVWSPETSRTVLERLGVQRLIAFADGEPVITPLEHPLPVARTVGDPVSINIPENGKIRLMIAAWWQGYRATHPTMGPAYAHPGGAMFPERDMTAWVARIAALGEADDDDPKGRTAMEFFRRWDAWADQTLPHTARPEQENAAVSIVVDSVGFALANPRGWCEIAYEWTPAMQVTGNTIYLQEVGGCMLLLAQQPVSGRFAPLQTVWNQVLGRRPRVAAAP